MQTVLQLANDYFTANPTAEGVSAYLYENHFRDQDNNYSHSLFGLALLMQWEINMPPMLVMPGNC